MRRSGHRMRAAGLGAGRGALVAIVLGTFLASAASAMPLSAARCVELRDMRDALEQLGVRDDLELSPATAAQTLGADRLARLKSYVVAAEEIVFRCGTVTRTLAEGMALAENLPDPKPERVGRRVQTNAMPLPVRGKRPRRPVR